jgi:hypothetical protein
VIDYVRTFTLRWLQSIEPWEITIGIYGTYSQNRNARINSKQSTTPEPVSPEMGNGVTRFE